tara:strand:+ start:957 stop:1262 length:306 start_codon:yes stop_codon:yes gene_type:complete
MKKFFVIFLIFSLILLTAVIKNSTKRIDDKIFVSEENIRALKKDYENIKFEYDYLSSTGKLLELQNLYFDDELVKKSIKEIMIINKRLEKLEIDQLKFINE